MKKIFLLTFLLMGISTFAQDVFLQESNAQAKKEAEAITDKYIPELALTGKQQLLFQQKVEEFLIRRYEIERRYSGKEKLDLLYSLQEEETAEMNDILTRPQLKLYTEIKPEIQPLEVVQKE